MIDLLNQFWKQRSTISERLVVVWLYWILADLSFTGDIRVHCARLSAFVKRFRYTREHVQNCKTLWLYFVGMQQNRTDNTVKAMSNLAKILQSTDLQRRTMFGVKSAKYLPGFVCNFSNIVIKCK